MYYSQSNSACRWYTLHILYSEYKAGTRYLGWKHRWGFHSTCTCVHFPYCFVYAEVYTHANPKWKRLSCIRLLSIPMDSHLFTIQAGASIVWLKLLVIFRQRATNYRALLRKITCKDKASYDSTPPCTHRHSHQILIDMWIYSLLHVECHSIKSSNLKFVSHMSQFVSHMSQPIVCGVSFNWILQSQSNRSLLNGTWQKRRREVAKET